VQAFQQWQQSPTQGMIPSVRLIQSIYQTFRTSYSKSLKTLRFPIIIWKAPGLSKRYSALFTAVCDALNSATEAIERCDDQPDE
jgi:hypothetical protein